MAIKKGLHIPQGLRAGRGEEGHQEARRVYDPGPQDSGEPGLVRSVTPELEVLAFFTPVEQDAAAEEKIRKGTGFGKCR